MSELSSTYKLADSVHSHLFYNEANQARGRIFPGEIWADLSEPYKTQRLTIFGEVEGRAVYQHLSKSVRTGQLYLTTVFTEPEGELIRTHITEASPSEVTTIIEKTLFMRAILQNYIDQP